MPYTSIASSSTVPDYTDKRVFPYSQRQLFQLVADVEQYPEFVPGWASVRIVSSKGDTAVVDQTLALGPLQTRFRSIAHFHDPESIRIHCHEHPFERFEIQWGFEPRSATSAEVTFSAGFELRMRMFGGTVERWLARRLPEVVNAFETRAHALYAGQSEQHQ